jgi:hypothetical protein
LIIFLDDINPALHEVLLHPTVIRLQLAFSFLLFRGRSAQKPEGRNCGELLALERGMILG